MFDAWTRFFSFLHLTAGQTQPHEEEPVGDVGVWPRSLSSGPFPIEDGDDDAMVILKGLVNDDYRHHQRFGSDPG